MALSALRSTSTDVPVVGAVKPKPSRIGSSPGFQRTSSKACPGPGVTFASQRKPTTPLTVAPSAGATSSTRIPGEIGTLVAVGRAGVALAIAVGILEGVGGGNSIALGVSVGANVGVGIGVEVTAAAFGEGGNTVAGTRIAAWVSRADGVIVASVGVAATTIATGEGVDLP